MEKNRYICLTQKVKTDFGSMYIHLELDEQWRPTGASISTPKKEPDAQITKLIEQLSEGLNKIANLVVKV